MKLLDLETGVPKLWELIKSKIGDYLPLAGGTMDGGAEITIPATTGTGKVHTNGIDTIFTAPSGTDVGMIIHQHLTSDDPKTFGIKIYDNYTSTKGGVEISPYFIGFTENDGSTTLGSTKSSILTKDTLRVSTGNITTVNATTVTASGDVTVSGEVYAADISTDSIIEISGDNGVVISSVNGGVTVSSDSGDVNLNANGEVITNTDLSVSGTVTATNTVAGTNFNYNGTITDTVAKAWGASLFDFMSGSLVSAKVIGLDTVNKIATVMYGLKCPNPATPLTITDEYDDTVVGRVWGGSNNGYVGGFVIAVPYNGTSLDITTTYEVS